MNGTGIQFGDNLCNTKYNFFFVTVLQYYFLNTSIIPLLIIRNYF
jgi:hypothetical protein